ncbi:MAG: [Fe-S]-binding protein [Deltaproteobacteria bacterium RIFCSPLOWO2_02_FULL_53_8]|nr:MAG: [Fe-S]-binding protein [Deltaproteobacteria bacterium RIFCSPLOWO2_02_FULL_53_8]
MSFRFDILKAYSVTEIRDTVADALNRYADILPVSKKAKIVIKPNMNSNMNSLTGNTTDLRLVAGVIEFLKGRGYKDITVCEGTNSGFYRSGISVISRLSYDRLARHYGVKLIDLNYSKPVEIEFENGVKAGVAKEVVEADFLINMPKLKTHFEAGMSVCLKNLMGCLVGQENKKKTHLNLSRNIVNINKRVKPNLHIVDGLISMEGLGPTRGTPIRTGVILIGTDPYLIDLAAAKLADFDYKKVRTLRAAEDLGLLTAEHKKFVGSLDMSSVSRKFKEPIANWFASFIHSPKRQRYFLAVRNTRMFTYLCSTKLFGHLLFKTGLRQDNFIKDEMRFDGFAFKKELCRKGCAKCAEYCPVYLNLPTAFESKLKGCIACQYCFLVCPTRAIEFKGELGFLAEQLRQYDEITREKA